MAAGLLQKLKSYRISGQIFGLISSFLSNRWFEWFWRGSLLKNIQLMLEFLKVPFLVLHFSCYTLMTFLMMLFEILLSMLMILLFILSVIKHLIYTSELLSDLQDTVDWGGKCLVDFNAGKEKPTLKKAHKKSWKMLLISSKMLFWLLKYFNFCSSPPSCSTF